MDFVQPKKSIINPQILQLFYPELKNPPVYNLDVDKKQLSQMSIDIRSNIKNSLERLLFRNIEQSKFEDFGNEIEDIKEEKKQYINYILQKQQQRFPQEIINEKLLIKRQKQGSSDLFKRDIQLLKSIGKKKQYNISANKQRTNIAQEQAQDELFKKQIAQLNKIQIIQVQNILVDYNYFKENEDKEQIQSDKDDSGASQAEPEDEFDEIFYEDGLGDNDDIDVDSNGGSGGEEYY